MKKYDAIAVGTGSGMNVVEALIQQNPEIRVAVIDKDEPGGICLTRGCIPSKILLYPAELVRTIERAGDFGIDLELRRVDFGKVMKRMRTLIDLDINAIRDGLSGSANVDYYHTPAEFVAPYTMKANNETITSEFILLSAGSKPIIPATEGLAEGGYLTSDTILHETNLPESIAIIGGGYIAAEYGHFLSAMGAKITIIGRNNQFLPEEEPEVSALAKRELSKHMRIITGSEVVRIDKVADGEKQLTAINRQSGEKTIVSVNQIFVAAGRGPTTDILHPERAGIRTDARGWIVVNEFLETSQPNVWAFGDINGKFLFKHVGNYESEIVYHNAVLKQKVPVDYHAVPHAVFSYPEIAAVGMKEMEAIRRYGEDQVLIGFKRYEETAKGEAMAVSDYFVKVILERANRRILGAHVIGPYASILIQEIVNLMYTSDQTAQPMLDAMHIHPAMSEVVQRAFQSLMTPEEYHHVLVHLH